VVNLPRKTKAATQFHSIKLEAPESTENPETKPSDDCVMPRRFPLKPNKGLIGYKVGQVNRNGYIFKVTMNIIEMQTFP